MLNIRSGADQREPKGKNEETRPDHEQGVENSHQHNDPTDQKSINNRAQQEKQQEKREKEAEEADQKRPTQIAEEVSWIDGMCYRYQERDADRTCPEQHGNKPSRGAVIDEQIQLEEEAELRKKGIEP